MKFVSRIGRLISKVERQWTFFEQFNSAVMRAALDVQWSFESTLVSLGRPSFRTPLGVASVFAKLLCIQVAREAGGDS